LFQKVLLQLVQQGVRFPHVGFLQEGQVALLIECPRPCGFEFLPEFPPDGLDLLLELPPRSFDFAFELSGKWLELLKEIAPDVTRAAVLRDPSMTAGIGQFAAIQAVAPPYSQYE
jgi:hypothetical protein